MFKIGYVGSVGIETQMSHSSMDLQMKKLTNVYTLTPENIVAARAMGEFGAVSVISGHLRGKTNTLPLHVEILFNEFKYVPAFAVSSILVLMAIAILIIRSVVEYKGKKDA